MEITREKIIEVLMKYISEDKKYLFYENDMYPNFVDKSTLINYIINDLVQDKEEVIKSCKSRIYGDESGLDKDECSCGLENCK